MTIDQDDVQPGMASVRYGLTYEQLDRMGRRRAFDISKCKPKKILPNT